MDDLLLLHVFQRLQDLDCESSDEIHREFMGLAEIIEVDGQELKHNADVLSEDEPILHPYYIVQVLRVIVLEVLEDLDLHSSLVLELLLVLHDFQCYELLVLVIEDFESLPEAALPDLSFHLIAVGDVVSFHELVIPILIIKPKIVIKQ